MTPASHDPAGHDPIRAAVSAKYARLARAAHAGETITDADPGAATGDCLGPGYTSTGSLPDGAVRASLGCGNPVAVAELRPGETVLDLGTARSRPSPCPARAWT